jgi:hypothetical protein
MNSPNISASSKYDRMFNLLHLLDAQLFLAPSVHPKPYYKPTRMKEDGQQIF